MKTDADAVDPAAWERLPLLEAMTFQWVNPLVQIGRRTTLEMDHLPKLSVNDAARKLLRDHDSVASQKGIQADLVAQFGTRYAIACMFQFAYQVLRVVQAVYVQQLISFLGSDDATGWGALYAAIIVFCGLTSSLCNHWYWFSTVRIGVQMRALINSILFRKVTRIKLSALVHTTMGSIVNMATNDAFKLELSIPFLPFILFAPLLLLAVLILLGLQLGFLTSFVGICTFLLLIPLQVYFARRFARIRKETLQFTDQRVKTVKEMAGASQVMKMYTWEDPITGVVEQHRTDEIQTLHSAAQMKAINQSLYFLMVAIPTFVVAVFHALVLRRELTTSTIFLVLALIDILRVPLGILFTSAVETGSHARVGFRRIDTFLALEEATSSAIDPPLHKEHVVELDHCSFRWDKSRAILQDICLNVRKRQLTMVHGPVGSSKSSLLMALLREMDLNEGTMRMIAHDCISYTPQKAWIFAGTLRDNIVFHRPFNREWYGKVVFACELMADLRLLDNGDQTVIGERGVNLSGGQQARVSLARAVYAAGPGFGDHVQLFLLDDPLSAVDAIVAQRIMDRCIGSGTHSLLRDRARVLVTHRVQMLQQADYVVELEDGSIVQQGPGEALRVPKEQEQQDTMEACIVKKGVIVDEDKEVGRVNTSVYADLTRAMGVGLVLLVVLMLAAQIAVIWTDYWLTQWTAAPAAKQRSDERFVIIYSALLLTAIVFAWSRASYFYTLFLRAASLLHNAMFNGVLYAPLSFFESNPVGRILNRFSKDQAAVDELLPLAMYDFITILLISLSAVVLVLVTNPWTTLILLLIVPMCHYVGTRYFASSREVKRLDAVTRSPVLALFTSTLDGVGTIRAFSMGPAFNTMFLDMLDNNNRAWITFKYLGRWLGVRLDFITTVVLFAASFGAVFARDAVQDTSLLSLSLVYSLRLAAGLQWAIRQAGEVENYMVSLERIVAYARLDAESDTGAHPPPPSWPHAGEIQVDSLSMRYRPELDLVLRDVSFHIASGAKIGICGRTGAGKSSLLSVFFRFVPWDQGTVVVDGQDIAKLSLATLRRGITVIPQTPTLFSGTVRYNLDPFGEHTDAELWDVINTVQLKTMVKRAGGLEALIAEYGSNVSVGEGQLLCVARAMLHPTPVLFVDEATASVDASTDQVIQHILRTSFASCTILTIAHRLDTIMDYDKVMVLDQGQLVEFDTPQTLMQNPKSQFRSMVEASQQ